jgi:hypothetical protein
MDGDGPQREACPKLAMECPLGSTPPNHSYNRGNKVRYGESLLGARGLLRRNQSQSFLFPLL